MTQRTPAAIRAAFHTALVLTLLSFVFAIIVRTQSSTQVVESWRCVASSASAAPIFGAVLTAGCPPRRATVWPRPTRETKLAEAIVPPGAPTGLSGAVNGATVALAWNAPGAGGTPTSYVVQAGSGPALSDLANFNTGSTIPALTVTNVSPGTYFVRVLATNAAGTSAPSNEIVVTVSGSCMTAPGAPTALSATVTGTVVVLRWQPATAGCAATSYVVQAGSASGLSNLANVSTGSSATSFTAANVGAGVYYVRVLAANGAGTSGASNEISLSVGACSGAPAAPSGLASSINGSTVTLSWTAASGSPTTYLIDVGSSPATATLGVIDNGLATTLTATGVSPGTYYVQVRAANACGSSPASNSIVVVVGGGPPTVLTLLHSFVGTDGQSPSTALLQAVDGNFYGTTNTNATGVNQTGPGVIYRVTPAGALTVLHFFAGFDGAFPAAPLIQASDQNFYGTTSGGQPGLGTVFRTTASGAVTVLHLFAGGSSDGAIPTAAIIEGRDGNGYGTTASGGLGNGTVFRMTPSGIVTVLYAFTGGADGASPRTPLVQATDGNFYGTTSYGGGSNRGTLFRITPGGAFSLLHTFSGGSDGGIPAGGLIQAADGNVYGTTSASGGSTFSGGTIFRIDLAGGFTLLHAFTGGDGDVPLGGVIQATDGNFYGTTSGGLSSLGTVFVMTPAGAVTTLHAFAGGAADGAAPSAPLIQGNDGSFYGTTSRGGTANLGTVFRISRR